MNNRVFIGLGSNIHDRSAYLKKGLQAMINDSAVKIVNFSSVYETEPVGYTDQEPFLNMVVEVKTTYTPFELLKVILAIEKSLGRKRDIKWGPRTLDLDILLFNQENIETEELLVPHPRMSDRAFVMIPLMEIDGELSINGVKVQQIVNERIDRDGVQLWKRKNGEDVFELFAN